VINLRTSLLLVLIACGDAQTISLAPGNWKANKVKAEPVNYEGKKALRVTDAVPPLQQDEDRLVILNGVPFRDGVVELEVAGEPGPGAAGDARGFVGIAFRVAPDLSKFECFYLRPTNGRADDQVRRNHSAEYIAFPEFPWMRLRKEFPEKYESYVDLVPGEWTKVRIEVRGSKGRLFVHGNSQPTLVIDDLKLAGTQGAIALWTGPGTLAHFANVRRGL
jgi:hypothetical protein